MLPVEADRSFTFDQLGEWLASHALARGITTALDWQRQAVRETIARVHDVPVNLLADATVTATLDVALPANPAPPRWRVGAGLIVLGWATWPAGAIVARLLGWLA